MGLSSDSHPLNVSANPPHHAQVKEEEVSPAKKEEWSAVSTASIPSTVAPRYPLTLSVSEHSHGENAPPPLMSELTAQIVPSGSTPEDQQGVSEAQKDRVEELRDLLVYLFQGLDRQPRWYPLMSEVGDIFEMIHGQQVDCSELIEAVPPEEDELEVPMPFSDGKQLEEVRRSFMAMAPGLTEHIEWESQKRHWVPRDRWDLPASAREDPLGFWGKIWDSLDFSSPQFFDTTLMYEEQAPDTALYMITLDRIYEQGIHLPASMSKYHHRDLDEEDKMSMYYVGRSNLQDYLVIPEGIRIRPRKQEPAIPFPWLDCELSRLKALNWELERGAEDYEVMDGPSWSVNYHDGLDYQDVIWGRDKRRHFEPHSRHHLLLTNVRVPLPRRILEDPHSLGSAMYQLYGEYHPLQMLGEARTLATFLPGIRSPDVDIKAAMLYLVIRRIANANPSIFDLLLDVDGDDPPLVAAV